MAPRATSHAPRWTVALGAMALCAGTPPRQVAAAPGAAPRAGAPRAADPKREADLEFNAALAAFGAWCERLAAVEREHPSELALTLRLAQCLRMRGETEPAVALVTAATERAGAAAMAAAQAELDAELGAASDDPLRAALEPHWREACEHFQRSLELDPSPASQLAVAMCHLRGGKLLAAAVMAKAARATSEPRAKEDPTAAQQLDLGRWLEAELERLQPSVTLRAHRGFSGSVRLDELELELVSERPIPVDPGSYTVSTRLSDARALTTRLAAPPGRRLELRIDEPGRALDTPRKLLVWGGAGLGATSAVTAGLMYWSAQHKWSALARFGCTRASRLGGEVTCPTSVPVDRPNSYNRAVGVFQIGGAAALVLMTTAAVAYFTVPRTEALRIVPITAPQHTGAALTGSF